MATISLISPVCVMLYSQGTVLSKEFLIRFFHWPVCIRRLNYQWTVKVKTIMPSMCVSRFQRKTSEGLCDEELWIILTQEFLNDKTIAKSASVLLKAFFFSLDIVQHWLLRGDLREQVLNISVLFARMKKGIWGSLQGT